MSAVTQQFRPGEKRDRLLGTALIVASALVPAWQLIPATRDLFDLGPAFVAGWAAWPYAGWRLRNSYGTDNHEGVQFRTPQARRRAVAFYFTIGLVGMIASILIQHS